MQGNLILETLKILNIQYRLTTHPPVMMVSEAKAFGDIGGDGCKNLFLYDKRSDRHYLVVMPEDKKAHSNTIRKQVRAGSLVFGSEENLERLLGVKPGSVSPFGIIYDKSKNVTVLIDEDLPKCSHVCFHPNDNTATVAIAYEDFERFLNHCGNEYKFVRVTN